MKLRKNLQPDFTIFPNPGGSILNWSSSLNLEDKIYNSVGVNGFLALQNQINTEDWAVGSYIIVPTKTGSPQGPPALWIKLEN